MIKRTQAFLLLGMAVLPASVLADENPAYAQTDPAETAPATPEAAAGGEVSAGSSLLSGLQRWYQGEPDDRPQPGADTDAVLAVQREGSQASANPQAASPQLREKAAARFMKTFDKEIPDSKNVSFKVGN